MYRYYYFVIKHYCMLAQNTNIQSREYIILAQIVNDAARI